MTTSELLYLSQEDVARAGPSMEEILEVLEAAFREKGEGHVEMPPKPVIRPGGGDNFLNAMPAYIPALASAGIKWVGGFPGNKSRGLPYITGLLVLNDAETGLPLAVMDCVWLTAMRTGAATALSARYLARPDSAVLGVLGCGVQARTHVAALKVLFPLTTVRAYDRHPERAVAYALEVEERFGLRGVAVDEAADAVRGCDIVVTAGRILKTPHATIQPGWLEPGAFASLLDYDSYWHRDALAETDKFCTDDTAQFRHHQEAGYFQLVPPLYADLGELVTGRKPGRETESERTIAANLGLALSDMAVAPLIYRRAVDEGIGVHLPL